MGFLIRSKRAGTDKKSLIKNIETVVIGYAKIDEDFLDDLEAVLLSGDLGCAPRIISCARSGAV